MIELLLRQYLQIKHELEDVYICSSKNLGHIVVVKYTHVFEWTTSDEESITIDMLELLAFTFEYSFDKIQTIKGC